MDDPLDIPAFLRLTPGEREEARARMHPDGRPEWTGKQAQGPHPLPEEGPGAVARRLGYPEHPGDAQARLEIRGKREQALAVQRYHDEARWAQLQERAASEKAEQMVIREAARANHIAACVKYVPRKHKKVVTRKRRR